MDKIWDGIQFEVIGHCGVNEKINGQQDRHNRRQKKHGFMT